MADVLVDLAKLLTTTTTLIFSDCSPVVSQEKLDGSMLIKQRATAMRHHVAYHARKRRYWVNGALLMMFIYMFFIWVATRNISTIANASSEVDGTFEFVEENEALEDNMALQVPKTSRCAINFFGLPRSFESMVLPSMTRNVFRRNARFGCDYFIHYYHREEESSGRAGQGGTINPDEVLLMKQRILNAAKNAKSTPNRHPAVIFVKDTEEEFWEKRGKLVEKYRTTTASDGNYLYYPWKAKTYHYPESLDNIVKQWHSIQSVWEAMEEYTRLTGQPKYDRVAMMRLDVLYALPVDIFKTDKGSVDRQNKYAVSPGFAKYPVNDRLFYGPYDAVKIWATERFSRLDDHVHNYEPGWGMHSERFLESAIFTAIEKTGIPMTENPDICVMRVRADQSVWMNDCITMAGTTRGMKRIARQKLIEKILGRPCVKSKLRYAVYQLHCPTGSIDQ
ncbi:expressed unknown protein [Seminavis robusta]|uniref:Uncharacterized protein n=1 Tax=Seminavis robusta TaxID=568900 RepID=A0A9N8HDA8_9STRA|nr:expressed unknown protein [Seminavis robusta]|eukprot:Sro419_g139000.1 n/a (449) ;mRNA; r:15469-16905